MAFPAIFLRESPATNGCFSPLSFFMKVHIHANLNSCMVSLWKLPVQNLTRVSFTGDISEEGSLDRVDLSMSQVLLVGPALTLEGEFLMAEMKALSEGTYVLQGVPGGIAVRTGDSYSGRKLNC